MGGLAVAVLRAEVAEAGYVFLYVELCGRRIIFPKFSCSLTCAAWLLIGGRINTSYDHTILHAAERQWPDRRHRPIGEP